MKLTLDGAPSLRATEFDLLDQASGASASHAAAPAAIEPPAGGLWPASLDLRDLDGSDGFRLNGVAADDRAGGAVASAGDVNGDGYDDVIVGAGRADANGADSGASYVVFGHAGGFAAASDLADLDGVDGFRIVGESSNDVSGYSVASAGDVNGDGYDDMLVGAFHADGATVFSGAAYVVFGHGGGFDADVQLSELDGANGFKLAGETTGDFAGYSVASAGDVNGDGFDDVLVGALLAGTYYDGASYVVYGKASGFDASIALSDLDGSDGFKIVGAPHYSYSGRSVSGAGDINGDGLADIIIGDPRAAPHGAISGASYVIFGAVDGFGAELDLGDLDGANGFKISGAHGNDYAGGRVAAGGDINGDGYDDLLVSAAGYAQSTGATYVIFGKAAGFAANLELSAINGTNGFRIDGEAAGNVSGRVVASAGDVNGDGFDDLIITADGNFTYGPQSYVVFGKASGFGASFDLSSLDGTNGFVLTGGASWASSAGDVNGDGLADIMVGVQSAYVHDFGEGAAYVVFGRLPDRAVNRVGTAASQNLVGGDFDDSLSGKGGDDHLYGNGGGDTLEGGKGDDTLLGGDGIDTASYAHATGGVSVDLGAGVASGADGADLLSGIENLIGGSGDDALTGDDGANLIDGGAGADTLDGGAGIDTLSYASATSGVVVNLATGAASGGAGGDHISGFEALIGSGFADSLTGGTGADTIDGGLGADTLDGGKGIDTLSYATATGAVSVDLATGAASGAGGADTISGFEAVIGGRFSDQLTGDGGRNLLTGGDGDDTVDGGAGNDTLDGGAGVDTLSFASALTGVKASLAAGSASGAGADAFSGFENLIGGAGADQLTGDDHANRIDGGAGDDTIIAGLGSDTLLGGEGVDTLSYASAAGGVTADLAGGALSGFEALVGGRFADLLTGDGGANAIFGGSGDDTIDGGGGEDTLDGGKGSDTVSFASSVQGVAVSLAGLVGVSGFENLLGGGFDDSLAGDGQANRIDGADGDDTILGGAGKDVLTGGEGIDTLSYADAAGVVKIDLAKGTAIGAGAAGKDLVSGFENLVGGAFDDSLTGDDKANRIEGGGGRDVLTGGDGADIFVFAAVTDSASEKRGDIITDLGKTDSIDLSAIDADTTKDGDQAFHLASSFGKHAGELILVTVKGSGVTLVEGDVDGDGRADLVITLQGDHHGFMGFVL